MEGSVTLKVKVRTFPSTGRARVHESVLTMIGAKEGETLVLAQYPTVWDEKTKTVDVTGYGDAMVDKTVIMISPEDMAALDVAEGDTISVIRKITWTEQITGAVVKVGEVVKDGAAKVGEAVKDGAAKVGEVVKDGAAKAGEAVKEGAAKAGEALGKSTQDIAETVTQKKGDKEQ